MITNSARSIALTYAVIASFWILFSDLALTAIVVNPLEQATMWQTVKGMGFVVVTSLLLFVLLRRQERHRTDAFLARRVSEERYRLLAEHTRDLIGLHDTDGRIIYVSPSSLDMLGYGPDELVNTDPYEIIHPDDRARVRSEAHDAAMSGVDTAGTVCRLRRKDGEFVSVEAYAVPVLDDAGEVTSIVSSTRDVSERQKAEDRIKLLATALDAAANGIVIADRSGTILWANAAFTRLTGYRSDEVVGGNPRMLNSGVQDQEFFGAMWNTILNGRVWRGELVNRRKNGTLYTEEQTVTPVRASAGEITHFIAIKQDVSDRKEYEHSLVEAKQRAEEMARLRDALLENMSHELRTPLTAIIGFSEVLAGELPASRRELADLITRSGERLMETLGSVLDLAQLESGVITLRLQPVDAGEHVRDTAELFVAKAHQKGLELVCTVPEETLEVTTDSAALHRIVMNLLSNAIKFTQEGRVEVEVRAAGQGVEIIVSDTGVGISPAFLHRIFEEFQQESTGVGRNFEGNGLGLSITRRLTALLGGSITVDSELGKGTRFTVILPGDTSESSKHIAIVPEPDVRWTAQATGGQRPGILVVEDNVDTQHLFRYLLGQEYDLTIVSDGDEALALMDSGHWSLVLLDISLGFGMTGSQLLGLLREHAMHRGTPVVAVTAHALPGDDDRFIQVGFDGYISKPFSRRLLRRVVDALVFGQLTSHQEGETLLEDLLEKCRNADLLDLFEIEEDRVLLRTGDAIFSLGRHHAVGFVRTMLGRASSSAA